jgi:hypothetical protein
MCTLNGGKGNYEPFEIKFLDARSQCSTDEALKSITDGLTDSISISSHVKGELDTRIFTIKNNVPEKDCELMNSSDISEEDNLFNQYSYETDIELLKKEKYVEYQNNGNFIYLIICNRNKVITNENGDLIPIDDESEKGVFTSFRGYFYVANLSDVDNPPTRYRVGKIRLKIPQFINPKIENYININKWIWKHFKFDFGKLYSVAQKTIVRYSNMSTNSEQEDDYTLKDNEEKAFASQTNLLLLGEKEINNDIEITPYLNPFSSYTNSYNHIVFMGNDVDNIEDLENSTPRDQNSQTSNINAYKPTDINIYEYNITTGYNANMRKDGIDVTNTGTTFNDGLKLTIELALNKEYKDYVPADKDIWSLGLKLNATGSIINEYKQLTSEPNDFLYVLDNQTPSVTTTDSSTGAIFKYFNITIPAIHLTNKFLPYFNILRNRYGAIDIDPTDDFLGSLSRTSRETYCRFKIQAVLSNGYNNQSYRIKDNFYITNSNPTSEPSFPGIPKPYIFNLGVDEFIKTN